MILKNFVVFEGIDGAGTSTQLNLLKKRPESSLIEISAEPTSCPTGKFLREILSGKTKASPQTAAHLFAADRAEHIYGENGIQAITESGKLAVSDRYLFSSLAYQGVTCGEELPRLINSLFPLPEILFFFDINPEDSLKRVQSRGEDKEIYENKPFLEKTAARYRAVISEFEKKQASVPKSERMEIIRIDAMQSKEEISKKIWTRLSKMPIFIS